jgi:hypothetical protein
MLLAPTDAQPPKHEEVYAQANYALQTLRTPPKPGLRALQILEHPNYRKTVVHLTTRRGRDLKAARPHDQYTHEITPNAPNDGSLARTSILLPSKRDDDRQNNPEPTPKWLFCKVNVLTVPIFRACTHDTEQGCCSGQVRNSNPMRPVSLFAQGAVVLCAYLAGRHTIEAKKTPADYTEEASLIINALTRGAATGI